MMNQVSQIFLLVISVISVFWICFTKKIWGLVLGLFLLGMSVSGTILMQNTEYLALLTAVTTIAMVLLFVGFSIPMVGSLVDNKVDAAESSLKNKIIRSFGLFVGLAIGAYVYFLLNEHLFKDLVESSLPKDGSSQVVGGLGTELLGEHVIALQLIAIAILSFLIGMGEILKTRKDENEL